MRNTKTKKIIIIAIILMLLIGGLLIVMPKITKKATADKENVWEYVFNDNIITGLKTYFSGEDYDVFLADKKYETTTEILFDGTIKGQEELMNHLKKFTLNITGKVNNQTNQAMGNIIANYMNNQMFKLDYIKDNQSFGIKSDEVIDMYLGVINNDLDLLAQKIGLTTNIKKIEKITYKDFLIDSQTTDLIFQDIKSALSEQISAEKIQTQRERTIELSGNQITVDSYTVILNDEETYAVLQKILEKFSEDTQLLENLNSKKSVFETFGIEFDMSKETLQSYIESIKNKTFTNEQMVMMTIYVLDNNMVKLDINITVEGRTTQYILETLNPTSSMKFIINTQEQEKNKSTQFILSKDENQVYTLEVQVTENDAETVKVQLKTQTDGTLESGNAIDKVILSFSKGEDNFEIKIVNTIKIVENMEIENLSAANCSYINDMEADKIQYLYTSIYERLKSLYYEKIELINSGDLQEIIKPANEEVETHNAKFEKYEGQYQGNIVVELLNEAIKSNASSKYLIEVETKFSETDETILKPEDVTVEKVQPVANLLDGSAIYSITIHYQPVSGAIDKIKIVKNGLESVEEEEQQVVIQEQEATN